MTLSTLCALAIPLCRMARDFRVRQAVAALAAQGDSPRAPEDFAPLAAAAAAYPADLQEALTLLGGQDMTPETLCRCFHPEALAFFHLCGQCSAEELLTVLTRCTAVPTAQGLAMLLGERRRQLAMARYGLQLLWRLCGDALLPDALSLFPEDTPQRTADDVITALAQRLKGDDANG